MAGVLLGGEQLSCLLPASLPLTEEENTAMLYLFLVLCLAGRGGMRRGGWVLGHMGAIKRVKKR